MLWLGCYHYIGSPIVEVDRITKWFYPFELGVSFSVKEASR